MQSSTAGNKKKGRMSTPLLLTYIALSNTEIMEHSEMNDPRQNRCWIIRRQRNLFMKLQMGPELTLEKATTAT